jgi:hypothetical protein
MRDAIDMAREAGFAVGIGSPALEKFERLIAMARADEQEACAKVCDALRHPSGYRAETQDWVDGSNHCAAAIRAR